MKLIRFLKKNYQLIIIFILTILAALPLFKQGYFSYHDIQHLARFAELDEAIKAGHFPVRWSEKLGFGYGYPIFVFYPPLIYYFAELFHLIGFSFIVSFKIMLFLGFVLSTLFMYLLVEEILDKKAAFLSAALYLFFPYRAVTVYVRGAMAGFFSFVWIPALFWSLIRFDKTKQRKYLLFSILLFNFVVITHSLIALPFLFFLVPFLIFLLIKNNFKNLRQLLIFGMLSLGLSAFFWLPVFMLKKYTLVDRILTTELASYKLHFVYLTQLWNSLWGFGGSTEGLLDGISFKIGKLHVLLAAASLVLLGYKTLKGKKSKDKPVYLYMFTGFLLLAVLLTLKISEPFWDVFPPLWYLQFPWRFLLFIGVFICPLAGYFLTVIKQKQLKTAVIFLMVGVLLFYNLKLFKPQFTFLDKRDSDYINPERIRGEVSRSSFEYLPKGVELKTTELGTSTVALAEGETGKGTGEIISGKGTAEVITDKPHYNVVEVNARREVVYRFNTTNFKGWKAYLDGEGVFIEDDNKLKLITVAVPEGQHTLKIVFKNRLIRISNYISLLSYLTLGYLFYDLKRNTRIH